MGISSKEPFPPQSELKHTLKCGILMCLQRPWCHIVPHPSQVVRTLCGIARGCPVYFCLVATLLFPPVLCSRKIPDKEPCSPPTLLCVLLLPLKRPLPGAVPGHIVAPHGGGGKAEITSALERWRCGASSGSSLCCSGPSRPAQPCCSHHSEKCIKQVINPKGNGLSGQAASHLMSSLII